MVKKGRKDKPDPRDTAPLIPREDQQAGNNTPPDAVTDQPMMVALPMDEYSGIMKELDEKRREARENFEGWQRERADFTNYKRRVEREQETLSQTITGRVIKKYLVILDDIELALRTRPNEGEASAWADGIAHIQRKLLGILEAEGVERIDDTVKDFNPSIHEAISHEPCTDYQTGEIIEVVQYGYKIGDWVLRPALVRVAR